MATRYVDFVNGSDANNGLGPDASAVTNKPWKTITKLLGASGMASGETAYLSPAGPFRETVLVAMTSATAETKIIGDSSNSQGFKTSGGVRVAPGPVTLTAYTTNDKTTPSGTTLLNLAGRDFLTFQNVLFIGGTTTLLTATTATSTNITFTDCALFGYLNSSPVLVSATCGFNTPLAWSFDRCVFLVPSANGPLTFTLTTGVGADYDANVLINNSVLLGVASSRYILVTNSGTSANKGGGVRVRNCTAFGLAANLMATTASQISTSIPCTVNNCLINTNASAPLNAGTAGQITENYNLFLTSGSNTNVTAGANSVTTAYAPLLHLGQERIWNGLLRQFVEPMSGSPLLGFGNDGNQTAYDLRNNPRPAGGGSGSPAVGALERANTAVQQQGTVHTGSNALGFTGPGYQDFLIPVDATATVFSIYARYDSTYAGTRPQISLLANPEIGVTSQTVTATTSALNAWEQESLASFTPTGKGFVTFRVASNDTNGGGGCFFDTFSQS